MLSGPVKGMAVGAVLLISKHLPLRAVERTQNRVTEVTEQLVHKALYKMGAAITAVVLKLGSLWRETTGDRHLQSHADSG